MVRKKRRRKAILAGKGMKVGTVLFQGKRMKLGVVAKMPPFFVQSVISPVGTTPRVEFVVKRMTDLGDIEVGRAKTKSRAIFIMRASLKAERIVSKTGQAVRSVGKAAGVSAFNLLRGLGATLLAKRKTTRKRRRRK